MGDNSSIHMRERTTCLLASLPEVIAAIAQNPVLLFIILLTLGETVVNGATDAPNAIATVVGTRVMGADAAVIMAAVGNFVGLVLITSLNTAVASTIFGMVDVGSDTRAALIALAAVMLGIMLGIYGSTEMTAFPLWLIVLASVTMGLGTDVGGRKIIKTVGLNMVKIEPYQGFAACLSACTCINPRKRLSRGIRKAPVSWGCYCVFLGLALSARPCAQSEPT